VDNGAPASGWNDPRVQRIVIENRHVTNCDIAGGGRRRLAPGFVNAHGHLVQWGVRRACEEETWFGWPAARHPIWTGIGRTAYSYLLHQVGRLIFIWNNI
jgi:hypothetical protein